MKDKPWLVFPGLVLAFFVFAAPAKGWFSGSGAQTTVIYPPPPTPEPKGDPDPQPQDDVSDEELLQELEAVTLTLTVLERKAVYDLAQDFDLDFQGMIIVAKEISKERITAENRSKMESLREQALQGLAADPDNPEAKELLDIIDEWRRGSYEYVALSAGTHSLNIKKIAGSKSRHNILGSIEGKYSAVARFEDHALLEGQAWVREWEPFVAPFLRSQELKEGTYLLRLDQDAKFAIARENGIQVEESGHRLNWDTLPLVFRIRASPTKAHLERLRLSGKEFYPSPGGWGLQRVALTGDFGMYGWAAGMIGLMLLPPDYSHAL